jgi:hypothetical protein
VPLEFDVPGTQARPGSATQGPVQEDDVAPATPYLAHRKIQ